MRYEQPAAIEAVGDRHQRSLAATTMATSSSFLQHAATGAAGESNVASGR